MAQVILLTSSNEIGGYLRSLGAYQISHWLRKNGYSSEVIDFAEHWYPNILLEMVERFIDDTTLAVGLSTTFLTTGIGNIGSSETGSFSDPNKIKVSDAVTDETPDLPNMLLEGLKLVKDKYPHLKFVAGGAQHFLSVPPLFDCSLQGHAEDSFLSYISWLAKKNPTFSYEMRRGLVYPTGVLSKFDINKSDFRWREIDGILPNEALPIELSRGCVFKCKFCAYPLLGKKKLDHLRSAEEVANEMRANYDSFGTTNYFACDDTINDSVEKIERLHAAITKLPFKIKLIAFARVDLLKSHPQTLEMLEDIGIVSFFFGVETFNQKAASIIGKGFSGDPLKQFLLDLKSRWGNKRNFSIGMITGLPGDTEKSILESQEFLKHLDPGVWRFNPLVIRRPTEHAHDEYMSVFSQEYKKYGFSWPSKNPLYWERDDYTYQEALKLADTLNQDGDSYARPSAWSMMALLSHGLDPAVTENIRLLKPLSIDRMKNYYKVHYEKRI